MGTIKKLIEIDDEDIINLKNARKFIYRNMHNESQYEPYEIWTLDDIIYKWENKGE